MTDPELLAELERVVAETEAALPNEREWTVEVDATKYNDDDPHSVCPWCGAVDEIYEHDVGVRWNSLDFQSKNTAIGQTGADEFEADGWICAGCSSQALTSPSDFEITDWF